MSTVEFISPNAPALPSKTEISKLCRKNGLQTNHLTHVHQGKKLFIKYNNVRMQEAHNQLFFYDQVASRPGSAIRIPEIYYAVDSGSDAFIVMEHVEIDHPASDEQRARALTELVTIKPPLNANLGPIGRGFVKHSFFSYPECASDVKYTSVGQLDRHINQVLRAYNGPNRELFQVNLAQERLVCYYSDLSRNNFPVDENNQPWVVDFDHAGVLPVSFMALALRIPLKDPIPWQYARDIPIERTENLKGLRRASWWFKIGCGLLHL